MNKNKKTKIKFLIASLIISLLTFLVLLYVESKVLADYEKINVVKAVKDIASGVEITEDNVSEYFEVVSVPQKDKVGTAYTQLSEIGDAFAKVDIEEGEQITPSKLIDIADDVMGSFKNPCEISCKVESAACAVSGTLRRGDYVAAYQYNDMTGELICIAEKLFISGAYNGSGGEIVSSDVKGNDTSSIMFSFIVEKNDVQELQAAFYQGDIFYIKVENIE